METVKKFAELGTPAELSAFLENRAGAHRSLSQYTTLTVLKKIVGGAAWHFCRPDGMNDGEEYRRIPARFRQSLYFACFTFMNSESMAMWGLYSIPREEGVRITFPGKAWREWLSGAHTVREAGGGRVVEGVPVFARDVAYMGRDRVGLYWNASSNKRLLQKHAVRALHEALPAGVKHYAWKYEQECRAFLAVPDLPDCSALALPLPQRCLEQLQVTYGPYVPEAAVAETDCFLLEQGLRRGSRSEFTGLVDLRDLCGLCVHRFQRRG